jgi:hypothetical protein
VHREQLVVLLVGHDVVVRLEELESHDHRHQAAGQEEPERRDQVQVPDDLVIGGGQPVGHDRALARVARRRHRQGGLLFERGH